MRLPNYVKAQWHEKVDERLQAQGIASLAFALLKFEPCGISSPDKSGVQLARKFLLL
jgi:hypothetical protein